MENRILNITIEITPAGNNISININGSITMAEIINALNEAKDRMASLHLINEGVEPTPEKIEGVIRSSEIISEIRKILPSPN